MAGVALRAGMIVGPWVCAGQPGSKPKNLPSSERPGPKARTLAPSVKITKAAVVFTHPDALSVTLEAAKACGIPSDRVILFEETKAGSKFTTIDDLVKLGAGRRKFIEPKIDARTKLAFLSFSSGRVCYTATRTLRF